MENAKVNKQKTSKIDLVAKILSVISLLFAIVGSIMYFFYIKNGRLFFLRSCDAYDVITFILLLIPIVLFVIYLFLFQSERKMIVLVPIILGACILYNIFITSTFKFGFLSPLYAGSPSGWLKVVGLVVALLFFLLNNKILVFSLAVCFFVDGFHLLYSFLSLLQEISSSIEHSYTFSLWSIGAFLVCIATVSFYVAMSLLVINKKPAVVSLSPEEEKARILKMKPEQALKLLKERYENGIITEEEYQEKRSEIISNL